MGLVERQSVSGEIRGKQASAFLTGSRRPGIIVQIVRNARPSPFLTSRQLADSLGVSESSIKRWVDDGTIAADRTAGGHRRISLAAAIGFIRRHGSPLAKPHLLPIQSVPQIAALDDDATEGLYEALANDRPAEARAVLAGRFLGGADIASLADDLIRPVMQRLGSLWHESPEGILLEHRAVDSCLHALSEIGSWLGEPPAGAPSAVTAGAPEDPYLLAPMLACLVLREGGIRAHNLGAFTPLETVGLAMSRYRARLCSISVSAAPAAKSESAWLALERAATESGGRIVVGGRSVGALPAKVRERVKVCASMTELRAYATGWLEGARGTNDGKGAQA